VSRSPVLGIVCGKAQEDTFIFLKTMLYKVSWIWSLCKYRQASWHT